MFFELRHTVLILASALAAAVLGGCGVASAGEDGAAVGPGALDDPDEVAACLPAGITLETRTTDLEGGDLSETVRETLARLKAKAKNHKILDLNGREVRFLTPVVSGRAMAKGKGRGQSRRQFTVVLIDPGT